MLSPCSPETPDWSCDSCRRSRRCCTASRISRRSFAQFETARCRERILARSISRASTVIYRSHAAGLAMDECADFPMTFCFTNFLPPARRRRLSSVLSPTFQPAFAHSDILDEEPSVMSKITKEAHRSRDPMVSSVEHAETTLSSHHRLCLQKLV